jgi:uncharacterized membrane protein HdeD (DUF308 family)
MEFAQRGTGDPGRRFAGVITLTLALAIFFAAHGIVQILTSLSHRQVLDRSWLWMVAQTTPLQRTA